MALFNKKKDINSFLDNNQNTSSLANKIANLFAQKALDFNEIYEQLLVLLISCDLGVETSEEVMETLKLRVDNKFLNKQEDIVNELISILRNQYHDETFALKEEKNQMILMVGVNGSGKTTTISKLANYYLQNGKTVGLIAADTFRAGAIAQIEKWADTLKIHCVCGEDDADPSSVLVDGIRYYQENPVDIILADTAGRLQSKANLMKELEKMVRVSKRELGSNDIAIWLVIDSTTGQNGLLQAESFLESSQINGIVLTKTDGTSKGGIALASNIKYHLPIRFITFGENIDAIEQFDIDKYLCRIIRGNNG